MHFSETDNKIFLPELFLAISFLLMFWYLQTWQRALKGALGALAGIGLILLIYGLRRSGGAFFTDWSGNHIDVFDSAEGRKIFFFLSLFIAFAVPFTMEIYRKWLTEQRFGGEAMPGRTGFRAALRAVDIIWCIGLAVTAHLSYLMQWTSALGMASALQLAFPFWNTIAQSDATFPHTPSSLSPPEESMTMEREKILTMLQEGKITADESAELLSALGMSARSASRAPPPLSPPRKVLLFGAVLVLIGFFLPWFTINLGQEINRINGQVMGQVQGMIGDPPANSLLPALHNFSASSNTGSVSVNGGKLNYGLGWFVMLAGLAAGAMPFLSASLDAAARRTITLIALSLGSLIAIYLLTDNLRYVSFGFLFVIVGYVCEWVGFTKERAA